MLAAGLFLVGAAWIRRMRQPNPVVNLSFLKPRNVIILALAIFVFRFTLLSQYLLVPAFLGNIQDYRPLETGQALAWVARRSSWWYGWSRSSSFTQTPG